MRLVIFALLWTTVASVDPIEVVPDTNSGPPASIQGTDLTTRFCSMKEKECRGTNIESRFTPSGDQCLSRCSRLVECLGVFYSKDQICNLRSNRCETAQLIDSPGGLDLYRLKVGESCPVYRPDYLTTLTKYSNRFCVIKGKTCSQNNMYPKPLSITPFIECLKKCAKITSCAGVDYSDGKCEPKGYQCNDGELADATGTDNYMRLEENQMTCPGNREVPTETVVPQPTIAPTEAPPAATNPPPPTEAPAAGDCTEPDVIRAEVTIYSGQVLNIAKCGKRYLLKTQQQAADICHRNGAVLASYDQLNEAFKFGLNVCRCGWLSDGQVKFPTFGAAPGGCGSSNTINNCPASAMGSWGGPGWNAFCFKEGCTDKIVEEKQISGGKIMNIAQCGKRYDLETKEEADEACKRNGAVLATYAQLEEAFKAGYSVCRCGWLDDGRVKWPIVGHAQGGCGKSDYINNCPAHAMGSWGGPGWNTFCFKPCDDEIRATIKVGDVVVSNIAKCGLRYQLKTKQEAQAVCERNDATLATSAQLTAAFNSGLSVCRCGWLEDGSAKWPIVGPAASGCGTSNTINNCPASAMGSWGGPGWNAFCANCVDKITAEKDIEGGTVINIAGCGQRYQMRTLEQARSVCNRNGAVLATYDQLEIAFDAGYSICRCGWLEDGSVKFPTKGPAAGGCGSSNTINDCPSRYMGSWGGPGWNAHCFKED